MKKMTDDEVKNCIFDIMVYLDEICRKYDIKYFLSDGTCLGAVRHKGFIPWDNDADVMMDRANYNKFYEVIQKENKDTYKLLSYFNDNEYFYPFFKLVDVRTKCDEHTFVDVKNMGVFVDIFPLDVLPDDEQAAKELISQVANIRRKLSYKNIKSSNPLKNVVKRILSINVNTKDYCKKIDMLSQKYSGINSNKIGQFCWGDYMFDKSLFDELIEMDFRNHKFFVPKKYDEYLTYLFGDYMTPPPEKDRYTHNFDAYWR